MKVSHEDLRRALRAHPRATGVELCRLLQGINRSTLARLVAQRPEEVLRLGAIHRTRYALRGRYAGIHGSAAASVPSARAMATH